MIGISTQFDRVRSSADNVQAVYETAWRTQHRNPFEKGENNHGYF